MGDRKLTFGKYKGWKVSDLILSNPDYLKWIDEHVPYFSLTEYERKQLGIETVIKSNNLTL